MRDFYLVAFFTPHIHGTHTSFITSRLIHILQVSNLDYFPFLATGTREKDKIKVSDGEMNSNTTKKRKY